MRSCPIRFHPHHRWSWGTTSATAWTALTWHSGGSTGSRGSFPTRTSRSTPFSSRAGNRVRTEGEWEECVMCKRNRVFSYAPYLEVLQQGMEPL